jgi:hypothetical protein
VEQLNITEAEVAKILSRRKFIQKVVADNTKAKSQTQPLEKRIVCDLRFTDMPTKRVQLQLFARLEQAISGVLPKPRPGIALLFKGTRIRGVNYFLRHDSLTHGVSSGHVKGWHEKIWMNTDGDKHIIDVNSAVGNIDLTSMIRFCCDRWNIEFKDDQFRLGGI